MSDVGASAGKGFCVNLMVSPYTVSKGSQIDNWVTLSN